MMKRLRKLRNWLIPMKKFKLNLNGLVLSVIGLLDNVTTLTAINNGAYELNPIVQPFLTSNELFAVFTIFKCPFNSILDIQSIRKNS